MKVTIIFLLITLAGLVTYVTTNQKTNVVEETDASSQTTSTVGESENTKPPGAIELIFKRLDAEPAEIVEGNVTWHQSEGAVTISGREFWLNIESLEEVRQIETTLNSFFKENQFNEDLWQAADGPSGYQNGYYNDATGQACHITYQPDLTQDKVTRELEWLSATFRIFCTE